MPKRSALTGHATLALLLAFQVLVSGLHAAPEVRGSTGRVPRDRGVNPKDFSKYKKGDTFACIGDEGTVVPASSINDDFCDCTKDGSDEPGTSACSYLKSSRFYCKANPSKNFYIYTSRVDDGICDCCDGEDETGVECPNTCKELAKKILEVKRKKASKYIKGLDLREQYVEKAVERMQGLVEERESLNRQTVSVDLHLPKLQEVADAYERVESLYKRQMEYRAEMNYIHKTKLRKLDVNTLRTILLPNLCIQGGKAGMEALMEQYKVDITFEERENTTIHQLFHQGRTGRESRVKGRPRLSPDRPGDRQGWQRKRTGGQGRRGVLVASHHGNRKENQQLRIPRSDIPGGVREHTGKIECGNAGPENPFSRRVRLVRRER